MADESPVKRKEREPITLVFGVILIVACILAVGIHINDNVLNDKSVRVGSSSTVEVDYSGSLYNFYDEGGALFQTSIKNIDENSEYRHISSYSMGSLLKVDMSNPTVLKGFSDALVGHKVGDTVRVKINAAQGYTGPQTLTAVSMTGITTAKTVQVSSLDSVIDMGWTYDSVFDDHTQLYTVTFNMANTDVCTSKVDDAFATVTTTNFAYAGDNMTYDVTVKAKTVGENKVSVDGTDYQEIEGFRLMIDGQPVFINAAENVDSEGNVTGKIVTKSSTQITNEDLYFVIKIVTIS